MRAKLSSKSFNKILSVTFGKFNGNHDAANHHAAIFSSQQKCCPRMGSILQSRINFLKVGKSGTNAWIAGNR